LLSGNKAAKILIARAKCGSDKDDRVRWIRFPRFRRILSTAT
jgi:hypothetical protein